MLNRMATTFTRVELWLFYQDIPPEIFPEIDCPLSAIRLIAVEHAHLPESYLQLLLDLMRQYPVELLVFASDGLGAELATRLAYRLNGNSCLQVEDCKLTSGKLEVIKPVYGNHLSARFILEHPPYCLSVAKQPCLPARMTPSELPKIEIITLNQPRTDCRKRDFDDSGSIGNRTDRCGSGARRRSRGKQQRNRGCFTGHRQQHGCRTWRQPSGGDECLDRYEPLDRYVGVDHIAKTLYCGGGFRYRCF